MWALFFDHIFDAQMRFVYVQFQVGTAGCSVTTLITSMFLLSMNERVVIRIQVEFVESGLSFAVDFEPMVALKSLLVEEGAIRA